VKEKLSTVLIIGSGAREDALAWKIGKSEKIEKIILAPGNGGSERLEKVSKINLNTNNIPEIIEAARDLSPDLVIIGQEEPLLLGAANFLEEFGFNVFGHTREAAILEGSKSFASLFMDRYNIPHPRSAIFHDIKKAEKYLFDPPWLTEGKTGAVIKADGLAGGKGAFICDTYDKAIEVLKKIMIEKEFGRSGNSVVIQEKLFGFEVSVMAIVNGENYFLLPFSKDHKQVFDNDQGQNTGGMGVVAPHPFVTDDLIKTIEETIIKPTLFGMKNENRSLRGVLYPGIMVTKEGPMVLEYNCRFGDPEIEAILPILSEKNDFFTILKDTASGLLVGKGKYDTNKKHCVVVTLASGGYPGDYEKKLEIFGLDKIASKKDLLVFHSATTQKNDKFFSSGGRVLMLAGLGSSLKEARRIAYDAIGEKGINFSGMHYRTDIGKRKRNLWL